MRLPSFRRPGSPKPPAAPLHLTPGANYGRLLLSTEVAAEIAADIIEALDQGRPVVIQLRDTQMDTDFAYALVETLVRAGASLESIQLLEADERIMRPLDRAWRMIIAEDERRAAHKPVSLAQTAPAPLVAVEAVPASSVALAAASVSMDAVSAAAQARGVSAASLLLDDD